MSPTPPDPRTAQARRMLAGWTPASDAQADLRDRYLAFIDQHADAADRDQRAGHLTASTILVDHSRTRVLLTLHPLANRWFQLGGHLESADASVADAAAREATEESGIVGLVLDPTPIGLDWHPTICRDTALALGPSSHLDIEHFAVAPRDARSSISSESLDLAWFAFDDLPEGADEVVRGMVRRVRELGLA